MKATWSRLVLVIAMFSGAGTIGPLVPVPCEGAQVTVHAVVPGPPGPGSYARSFDVPGFDPILGTLTSVDLCVTMTYACSSAIGTEHLQPFLIGVPVDYSINVGMGASFGYYDAAGYVALCDASSTETYTGTLLSFTEARFVTPSGVGTGCATITNPTTHFRFVSPTPVSFYMGMDRPYIVNFTVPAYPTATAFASTQNIQQWDVEMDATYHYTPHAIPTEAMSWGAVKARFRR